MKKLGLLIFFLSSCLFANSAKENLNRISFEDRYYLRCFFRDFVYENHLGFIFFDEKPAALMTHTLQVPSTCIYDRHGNSQSIKGWYVWKKVENLFPHPNFLFIEEIKSDNHSKHRDIFVINKKNLLSTLERYQDCFKSKLGNDFSPSFFLKDLEENGNLRTLLKNDEELLGIILGYGRESSKKFLENNRDLTRLCSSSNPCRITGVIFMGDPTSCESKYLIDQYYRDQILLCKIYKDQDPLLVTLSMLQKN